MDSMEILVLIFCVIPALVTSITILPNGNSPEVKMIGGMMVDMQNGFVPMTTKATLPIVKSSNEKSRKLNLNSTKLSINERYRRLIPYMTFYYANDVASTTESYESNVEVEKAQIVEAQMENHRQPKKIIHSPYRNIPRYQGNRLGQYNIESPIPPKIYYKTPHNHQPPRVTSNYNYYLTENQVEGHDYRKFAQRPSSFNIPSTTLTPAVRKPYLNFFQHEDSSGVQYYLSGNDAGSKYKLIPYEQTPPVKVFNQPSSDMYDITTKTVPVPVQYQQEQVYLKPRLQRPQYTFDDVLYQSPPARKPPTIVSENYYEKVRPQQHEIVQPVIHSGFKPIMRAHVITTENPAAYTSTLSYPDAPHVIQEVASNVPPNHRPNYYQYVVDNTALKPTVSSKLTLGDLLDSLQLNKSVPKPLTRDNVGSSIRTLLQVLNTLRAEPHQNAIEPAVLKTPRPFEAHKVIVPVQKPIIESTEAPIPNEVELHEEPYLAPVHPPSQHLDEHPIVVSQGSSQRFPLQIENDDEGGTPGRPGEDYPILTTIPPTSFDCKTQRYKGFFADPETRCQVWHYCDLNGGQASFLCPNGTIFSQAGLTCDWWFNVRCASTTQLYVLNESLYKYILPHSPKFPEDYSGPLVDKYLTLKFKEMEEQFKKNKSKQSASEKTDSDEDISIEDESTEDTTGPSGSESTSEVSSVTESSVRVDSPGTSGNVERLQDS